FILKLPEEDDSDTAMDVKKELLEPWILFTDGSSCADGSGAGQILTNPEGAEFTYALRFRFEATNNEAEYEALIAGLRIAEEMGVKNLQANVDSRHEVRSSQSLANRILLANYSQGCKGTDKGMTRLPGSQTCPKNSTVKVKPNHIPMAILQMGN
ncbi:reverse transcriptase domain-containing protein, partial [Tanacetum coccineum]